MGRLIDGEWAADVPPEFEDGRFIREPAAFRSTVGARGSGTTFEAEEGRYRLYVHEGCPWSHRTRVARLALGLEDAIEVVCTRMVPTVENGWVFDAKGPYAEPEGRRAMHEVYADGAHRYTGRATVPLLWDTRTDRIVNNESGEIIRIFNDAFRPFCQSRRDLAPTDHRDRLDQLNERIYEGLNNAAYRAGFAQTQQVHDEEAALVFATLDWLEELLSDGSEFLIGGTLTEADIRTGVTLFRMEAYREAFYCDLAELSDYPRLMSYRERLRGLPSFAQTLLPPDTYVMAYSSIPFAAVNNPNVRPRRVQGRVQTP